MVLKPQDVLVVLKLLSKESVGKSYAWLAEALGMSPSEVHAAVRRAAAAGLVSPDREPNARALCEFVLHGLRYVFVAELGAVTRGFPTAYAAPPLSEQITPGQDLPPVWPDPDGPVRGEACQPLYPAAVGAARRDSALYELLALVDAVRIGRARERRLAEKLLRERICPSD